MLGLDSIEPFVGRIKLGGGDNDDFHAADGSMAGSGVDHDGRVRTNWDLLAVQFHPGIRGTLQEEIGFRDPLVVMDASVRRNFGQVKRIGDRGRLHQSAPGRAARAGGARQSFEIQDFVGCGRTRHSGWTDAAAAVKAKNCGLVSLWRSQ